MTEVSISRHCKYCEKQKRFTKQKQNTMWGVILTVFTCGTFLIYWGPAIILQTFRPYRCVECGKGKR